MMTPIWFKIVAIIVLATQTVDFLFGEVSTLDRILAAMCAIYMLITHAEDTVDQYLEKNRERKRNQAPGSDHCQSSAGRAGEATRAARP